MANTLPAITPMPPVAAIAMPWDESIVDPVAEIAAARATCGDTFVVESGDDRYLFLFSPAGVHSFYELPENEASKGYADYRLLVRKLPEELFVGRRTIMHTLFGREDVASYLTHLDRAIDVQFEELGDRGEFEAFAFTRRLGHRLGLTCWGGVAPTRSSLFDELVVALDALDGAAAFVNPGEMAAVAAQGKRAERDALAHVEALMIDVIRAHDAGATGANELFSRIVNAWGDTAEPDRSIGIARDVIVAHLGSMSNLFAAMGWMIVHLVERPAVLARVRDGEAGFVEKCALESTRIAQRSIMLRSVMAPTRVSDENATYEVAAGAIIGTLLPLTNTTAMPGLDGYDPDRWQRRRLRDERLLPARELVTTFGHGSHTCPAQPFSLSAMSKSASRLVERYDLEAAFDNPRPVQGQIGGVARSQNPCTIRYSARETKNSRSGAADGR
ncbi:MAG: cytochrome [Acidimicrobiales bacterium]